jgi:hypothetical protein
MIRKIFPSIIIINVILINLIINFLNPELKIEENVLNKLVDIKNTNDLINTYSNLLMEIGPANE